MVQKKNYQNGDRNSFWIYANKKIVKGSRLRNKAEVFDGKAVRHVDRKGYLQINWLTHVDRCCIEHHYCSEAYHFPLTTKDTYDHKRETASTDSETYD